MVADMEGVPDMAEELHTGALEPDHFQALELEQLELELDSEVDNKLVLMEALAQLELMGLSLKNT